MRSFVRCLGSMLGALVFSCAFANAAFACTSDEIDVLGDGTQCETVKLEVTTTSAANKLVWNMAATGEFYVDCGDGGTLTQSSSSYGTISGNTITRTNVYATTYTCTWSSAGVHTVRFGGTATGYNTTAQASYASISFYKSSGGTQTRVASISGSLGAMFPVAGGNIPRFYQTFYNCTNLTSIPAGLFSGLNTSSATNTSHMFYQTFSGCSRLTGNIPAGLFSTIDTSSAKNTGYMFYQTFYNCNNLTSIPADLFSTADTSLSTTTDYMFYGTFEGCSSIGGIPTGLFSAIDTSKDSSPASMFRNTFSGCSSLSGSIPEGLFSKIKYAGSNMFAQTFYNCSNLSGYIPVSAFDGLFFKNSPSASAMWTDTFTGTNIATSCDSFPGMTRYVNGYESSWNGRVACRPACANDEFIVGPTICAKTKFTVTTTSDATSLKWTKSAKGDFYVDCGDGGTLSGTGKTYENEIIRTNLTADTYTCTWASAGAHTVRFGGTATEYFDGNLAAISFYISGAGAGTQGKVASLDGSLGAMFPVVNGIIPRFPYAFSDCSNLTSIPAELFSGIDTSSATKTNSMFSRTFYNCTNLTSIPAGLFSDIDTSSATDTSYMFLYTFSRCTNLSSIPAGLFSGIDTSSATDTSDMFSSTFNNTGITSIPADLFSGTDTSSATDTSYMFNGTFSGCTNLSSIPAGLFSAIDTSHATNTYGMFMTLFSGCSNLTGYIPPTTFPDTIHPDSSSGSAMWSSAFSSTQHATSCDSFPGMTQYITGFESSWGYSNNNVPTNDGSTRVSCAPCAEVITLPEHASFVQNTCDWTCDSGYLNTGTSCETAKFSVTTTTLEADETVSFSISAAGEFYVDCGVDGVLSGTGVSGNVITRADTTNNTYTCTYSTGGDKTISFAGVASAYSNTDNVAAISFYSSSNGTQAKIAAISGSLGALFPTIGDGGDGNQPRFFETFRGASNFVGPIPANLFSGVTGAPVSRMFNGTFRSTGLQTAIPSGLFAGLDGAPTNELFANTWRNCQNMTGPIPEDLFAGIHGAPATKMFFGTFATNASDSGEGYSGETGSITGSIPSNLFAGISGAPATSMFHETFCGQGHLSGTIPEELFAGISGTPASSMFAFTFCGTGLSGSIPEDLFAGVSGAPASSMFLSTFKYCAGLTGSIPEDLFAGISGAPASGMFRHTFYACSGLTGSIPGGLFAGLQGVPKGSMFQQTFARCSNLTGAIPANLFAGISGAPATWMFAGTFQNCSKLSGELPAELFAGISGAPKSQMFNSTFAGCSSLSGYIPPTFFAGISTETTIDDQMANVFNNSGLDTECPDGMTQYMTGFEDFFTGKVSCEIVCDDGYHSDNNMCIANIININWSDVDDNGTATVMNTDVLYNGDIVTPVKAMNYPGKIFRGWIFNKPEEEGGE